jgi:hypothetical protein
MFLIMPMRVRTAERTFAAHVFVRLSAQWVLADQHTLNHSKISGPMGKATRSNLGALQKGAKGAVMDLETLEVRITDLDIVQRTESTEFHRRLNILESALERIGDKRDVSIVQEKFDLLKQEFESYKREVAAAIKLAVVDANVVNAEEIALALSKTILTTRQVSAQDSRAQVQTARPAHQTRVHVPEVK